MKFLFAAPRLHPNFQYQIKALIESGHQVEFCVIHSARAETNEILSPHVLGYSKLFLFLSKLFSEQSGKLTRSRFELNYGFPPVLKFFNVVRNSGPDAIVVKNIASAYSLLAFVVGWLLRKKLIAFVSIEKYRKKQKSWSVHAIGKIFGAKAITPLEGDRKYENKNDNLFFVPLPHPVLGEKQEYAPGGKVRIICVGKFSKRKDLMLLLKAANELKKEFTFYVTLIGLKDEGEYLKQMLEYIDQNGLKGIVTIKFDVPWKLVYGEYEKNDIFVLPSYNELHSFAALEAMACGLPAVVTEDNGIKWYVKDGENGYIIKTGDLKGLIQILQSLLAEPDKLKVMGRYAQETVRNKCSMEGYCNSLVKLVSN